MPSFCCRHPGGAYRPPLCFRHPGGAQRTPGPSGAAAERRRPRPRTTRGVRGRVALSRAAGSRGSLRAPGMTKAEGGRGDCAKSPYGRCPNPSPINPLPFFARNLPASPPTSAIIPGSRRTGARSAGDPQRRRERKERAQPEAGSRKGSLAEGMRGRAGWKAGRLKGAGWIPAPVQEMVAAIPARRVQKDPSPTARPIVRACGSPSARSATCSGTVGAVLFAFASLRRRWVPRSAPRRRG